MDISHLQKLAYKKILSDLIQEKESQNNRNRKLKSFCSDMKEFVDFRSDNATAEDLLNSLNDDESGNF